MVCSNERGSNQYKSTVKNYSTENFNVNVSRNNVVGQSKMSLVSNNNNMKSKQMFADTVNPMPDNNSNMIYSYQPYLSL